MIVGLCSIGYAVAGLYGLGGASLALALFSFWLMTS